MLASQVAFSAGEGACAPMTWGQRAIWEPLLWFGDDTAQFNNPRSVALARPVSVEAFMAAVRALVERHQAMRTHFAAGQQHIAGSGQYPVELCDGADAVAVAERLAARPFQLESEWPARIAGIRGEAGLVTAAAVATSHVAMDGWALDTFITELAALLDGGDGTGGPSDAAWEPLDQVGFETSARGQRVSAAAIAHWRAGLSVMPPTMFDFPTTATRLPIHQYVLESAAVSAAAPVLAQRSLTSLPTVLATVTALLLAASTGHDMCALQVIVGNRVRHRSRLLCAPTAQNGLMVLPVPGDASLTEAMREAARPATEAYLQGHYDPADLATARAEIETARGARFDLSAYFNFHHHSAEWAERAVLPSAGERRGRLTRLAPVAKHDMKFYLNVTGRPGSPEAGLLLLVNAEYLPEPAGERILRGIETLLCEAVTREVAVAEIAGLAGLTPAHRGEGWFQTGAGWAHLPTVAELVRQATGDLGAAVFPRAEPAGLVAFTQAATDPVDLHRRVMDKLAPGAVAPAYYVVTRQAPGDPASLAAWEALPAEACGTGRA